MVTTTCEQLPAYRQPLPGAMVNARFAAPRPVLTMPAYTPGQHSAGAGLPGSIAGIS